MKKEYTAVLQRHIIVALVSVAVFVASSWFVWEYVVFQQQAKHLRAEYEQNQKETLVNQVDRAVEYIKFQKSKEESLLRRELKSKVLEAYDLAQGLYEKYQGTKSDEEVKSIVMNVLSSIRWNKGRGYFFGTDTDGKILFHPREGANVDMVNRAVPENKMFIHDILELVQVNGEGYVRYMWEKPPGSGNFSPKLSYAKIFKPFNWIIATSEYLDDQQQYTQQMARERLASIRFAGGEGFIFVIDYNGVAIIRGIQNEVIGTNLLKITDAQGKPLIKDIIRAARHPGGGFVKYKWHKPFGGKAVDRIIYVKGIADWRWCVGSGLYLDGIEGVLARQRSELLESFGRKAFFVLGIIIFSLILSFIASNRIINRAKRDFEMFFSFFSDTAISTNAIDPEKLRYREFEELAESANKMLRERNRYESDLKNANRDVTLAMEELKKTQVQLVESEKMSALGGLVAGVSHEINTPVGIGVTAASHLREKTQYFIRDFEENKMTRSGLKKFLELALESSEMILSNLSRAADLVHSFKQVAVDQSSEAKRKFNLKDYIEDVLRSLRPRYKRTKHTISVKCDENIDITSYPGALSQVLTNLINNSLLHGFEGIAAGHIIIAAHMQENSVILQYRDNGRGMPEHIRAKIFEPFFTTRRGSGGSGLGMHLVYNLVTQNLQGRIECLSSPGRGTTFSIILPMVVQERE